MLRIYLMLLTWMVVSSPIMATSNDPNNGGGSPVGLQV